MIAEDTGHEQRVVPDMAAQHVLLARIELRGAHVPGALDREQRVDHGVEAALRHRLDGAQGVGPREAREQVGEIARRGRIVEDQVTECLTDDAIEEAGKQSRLHAASLANFRRGTDRRAGASL